MAAEPLAVLDAVAERAAAPDRLLSAVHEDSAALDDDLAGHQPTAGSRPFCTDGADCGVGSPRSFDFTMRIATGAVTR